MDQKNTFVISIVVILVVAGGLIWWYGYKNPAPTDSTTSTTTVMINNSTTTVNNIVSDSSDVVARAYTQTRTLEAGKYVTTVNLTDTGFSPVLIYINRGESVRFVNKTDGSMRVATNEFQNTPVYSGFGQEKSVGLGGKYEFTFTKPGVFGYSNLNASPMVYGIVNVR